MKLSGRLPFRARTMDEEPALGSPPTRIAQRRVTAKGPHMAVTELFDTDALDFVGIPVWYERHPSQAEGEDN